MSRKRAMVDPAVLAVLGDGERRGKTRRMSARQRKQAARDAVRQRVTLEVDRAVMDMVRRVATREGVSPAGVCSLFLAEMLMRYADGEIDFAEHTRPSRSPRYEWVVTIDGEAIQKKTGL